MNALRFLLPAFVLSVGGAASAQDAEDERPYADRPQTCRGCHATLGPEDVIKLTDGSTISVHVDAAVIEHSIHGSELSCTDCHRTMRGYPHEPIALPNRRQYRLQMSQTCNQCHYDYFQELLGSVHFQKLREDDLNAPTCVDCHGFHAIEEAGEPRLAINEKCAECHQESAEIYADSVHGQALAKGAEHAPTCTDCHGAHGIEEASKGEWQIGSYQVCATCHGDPEKMAEYELSTNVLDTYLDDFHGMSNYISVKVGHVPANPIATCGDCHGAHDVEKLTSEEGTKVARERVADMCRKCHDQATDAFAGAWMGHQNPSLSGSPLVWVVMWGYRILIPVMILGLLIHIFMHFWRAAVESVRRSSKE